MSRSSIPGPISRCCAASRCSTPNMPGGGSSAAGINLTHLYHGTIPFLWYIQRELGFMHKYFRGVATAGCAAGRRQRRRY